MAAALPDAGDEFVFLAEQAEAVGATAPLPHVERIALPLADGRTLSGLRWGDAPPVVTFLHGAGLNAHTWDRTVLALGLPALALDLAGHGDSSWRRDATYTPATLAPDVVAALAAWTDGPQTLVGHSLGGLTAIRVAALEPDRVAQLTIVDITPGVGPSEGRASLAAFFAGPTDWADREELVDRAVAFGLGGTREAARRGVYLNSRIRDDGRVEWKHHFAHLAAAAAASAARGEPGEAVEAVLGDRGWDDLARVTAPTLLLRGERGFVSADDAAEFARRAPDAAVETVPSGHNPQEERPVELARRVRATTGS